MDGGFLFYVTLYVYRVISYEGYQISLTNQMSKENDILKSITQETPMEVKARVHKEFAERMQSYQATKQKEVAKRKANGLTRTSAFKLSENDHAQLKEVSGMLGITPSEFVRDSIKEAVFLMKATPTQLKSAVNKLTQNLK